MQWEAGTSPPCSRVCSISWSRWCDRSTRCYRSGVSASSPLPASHEMCVVFATDEGGAVVIGRSRVATKPDRKSTAGHAGPRQGASIAVGLIGLVIGAAVALNILAAYDWDTSVFIKFGARDTARQAYAERWLGPDIELAPNMGHDGKFFFMQAMDPFYL